MTLDDLTAPHCDPAILHAPGECSFCDQQPEWQALRQLWGICFTGHPPATERETACPSDLRRPGGVNQLWPGNQARSS
jgi:hypothetical protein